MLDVQKNHVFSLLPRREWTAGAIGLIPSPWAATRDNFRPMSDAKRAQGLSQPGMWLARVTMPPRKFTRWGWAWRLTMRGVATLAMSAIGVLGVSAALTSGRMDWFEFLLWAAGWIYSVLWTTVILLAFARRSK